MNVEEILIEARGLPREKRGELIGMLLEDFDAGITHVDDAEVARRVAETGSGKVADISHEELLAGLEIQPAR